MNLSGVQTKLTSVVTKLSNDSFTTAATYTAPDTSPSYDASTGAFAGTPVSPVAVVFLSWREATNRDNLLDALVGDIIAKKDANDGITITAKGHVTRAGQTYRVIAIYTTGLNLLTKVHLRRMG